MIPTPLRNGAKGALRLSAAGRSRVKQRVQARSDRRPYQTVAIGLYADQTQALDHAIEHLQQAGYIKANRSLIFQTLAERFLDEISGLTPEQMLEYLLRSHFRRPLARASQRSEAAPAEDKRLGRDRVRTPRRRELTGKMPPATRVAAN